MKKRELTDVQSAVLDSFITSCEGMGFGCRKELRINNLKIVVYRDSGTDNTEDANYTNLFDIHTYKNEVVVDDVFDVHIDDLKHEIKTIATEAREFQLAS